MSGSHHFILIVGFGLCVGREIATIEESVVTLAVERQLFGAG